ncbi:MAG: hypothetical protein JNM85_02495 [Chthonomonas sp.]|nr:hypothetical protein [Chthonomonas sp.]
MTDVQVSREEFEELAKEVFALRAELAALRISAPAPDLDEETVGVIAAAVAAYLGKRARIRVIRRVNQDEVGGWATQGRTKIYGSHHAPQMRGW